MSVLLMELQVFYRCSDAVEERDDEPFEAAFETAAQEIASEKREEAAETGFCHRSVFFSFVIVGIDLRVALDLVEKVADAVEGVVVDGVFKPFYDELFLIDLLMYHGIVEVGHLFIEEADDAFGVPAAALDMAAVIVVVTSHFIEGILIKRHALEFMGKFGGDHFVAVEGEYPLVFGTVHCGLFCLAKAFEGPDMHAYIGKGFGNIERVVGRAVVIDDNVVEGAEAFKAELQCLFGIFGNEYDGYLVHFLPLRERLNSLIFLCLRS